MVALFTQSYPAVLFYSVGATDDRTSRKLECAMTPPVRDDSARKTFDEHSARMKSNQRGVFELFHPAKIWKIPESATTVSTIGKSPVSPEITSLTRTSELVANVAVVKRKNARGGLASVS